MLGHGHLGEYSCRDAHECEGSEHTSAYLVKGHLKRPLKYFLALAPRCTTQMRHGLSGKELVFLRCEEFNEGLLKMGKQKSTDGTKQVTEVTNCGQSCEIRSFSNN
jgi:hypothetical protein